MKIIHMLSNWKWTERSEPVVDLVIAQKALGADVHLVCGQAPKDCPVADVALNAGYKELTELTVLSELTKHFNLLSTNRAIKKIRNIIKTEKPDIIHCHMQNAHFLSALSCRKELDPIIVRTFYNPEQINHDFRSKWCVRKFTHGMIVVSEKTRSFLLSSGVSTDKIELIEPGIEARRFSPDRSINTEIASSIGNLDGFFVAGLITRIRKTRRLDIPLQALYQLHQQYPQLRLLLVGRGRPGAFESVVKTPASELGIRDLVYPAGYCQGDDLVAALRKMKVLIYPMPGTDKTCRTVREAMSAGVPVIAPKIGFLSQLIQDGINGRLVDLDPDSFTLALKELIDSPDYLEILSQGAIQSAQERFDLSVQAKKTLQFYQRVLRRASQK